MPVYRRSRLIHIHIPKTAGTAIEGYFHSIGDMVWGRESWLGQEYLHQRWYEFQHLSMSEFQQLTDGEFRDFHSFAVVRNPYSRLLSDFHWRRSINQQRNAPLVSFDTFRDYLLAIPQDIDVYWPACLSDASRAMTNFLIHVRPQHHYVHAVDGQPVVKDLLRFERLRPDFERLLSPLGLETDRIRTPTSRDFASSYDRDMLDRVNMIYARDFQLGPYEML